MIQFILFFSLSMTTYCYAYLGPGMSGGILAATSGIIVAIFGLLFGILWFPIKRFFKNRKKKKENKKD